MAKILLTHPYFLRLDTKQWNLQQPYPPLATLILANVLRNKEHEVYFWDAMFAHSANEIQSLFEQYKPDYFIVYADAFNYLTKMCLSNMQDACFSMIDYAKKEGCVSIIASSDSTDHTERYLRNGADFVVIGEAEHTITELIAVLEQKNDPKHIQGLAFLTENAIFRTFARNVEKDLDVFPHPAWDLIDIIPYQNAWKKHGYFSMNVATTRGCPFKCNWCAKPTYGNRYNSHSPERIVEEIAFLIEKFSIQHIWFCDDIFGLKPNWIQEFNNLVQKKELKFRYKIQSRADLLLESDTIQCLAQSGCDEVWIGAESGSQHILDAMDKGITLEQITQATHLLKKHHIKPCFFLQFGYLGEQYEDIEATLNMVFTLMPYNIGVSVSYPLPGTKFYEIVKSDMKTKTNWTDSDDLALMFRNTYPPEFYKLLHRYLHKKFRAKQALQNSNKNLTKLLKWAFYLPQIYWYSWKMNKAKNNKKHKTTNK
jgi:radical SAM superfamily enzyme YgiQ (UPF0313 family)